MKEHKYYVYIMASNSNTAIYVGVTSNITGRVYMSIKTKYTKDFQQHMPVIN
jgi:predicted GIY-YIG superfamily endonuclease